MKSNDRLSESFVSKHFYEKCLFKSETGIAKSLQNLLIMQAKMTFKLRQ